MQANEFTKRGSYFFKAAKSDSMSSGVASSLSASPFGMAGPGGVAATGGDEAFDFAGDGLDWVSVAKPDLTVANSAAMSSAVAAALDC